VHLRARTVLVCVTVLVHISSNTGLDGNRRLPVYFFSESTL